MILDYYNNHIIILSNTATDITLYLAAYKWSLKMSSHFPWWLVMCHKKSCCRLSFTFWSIASLKPPAFTRLCLQRHSPPAPNLKEASSHKLTHIRMNCEPGQSVFHEQYQLLKTNTKTHSSHVVHTILKCTNMLFVKHPPTHSHTPHTQTCIPMPVMAFPVITVICQKHTLIYGQIKNTPEKKLQVLVTLDTVSD